MTSEEFRTNPLFLRNQFERSGTFEIPVIKKEEVSLENLTLIGYDKISSASILKCQWQSKSITLSEAGGAAHICKEKESK